MSNLTPADASGETVFDVEGVACAACVRRIETALARVPGVEGSALNFATRRIRIQHDATLPADQLAAVIARAGYRARVPGKDSTRARKDEERKLLWRLSLAGFVMMQVMMFSTPTYLDYAGELTWDQARLMALASLVLTVPVMFFSADTIFLGAWHGLKARAPGMDVPIALGIVVSFIASLWSTFRGGEVYYDMISMFVFFVLCGRYFEARALAATADANDSLVQLLPRKAWRIAGSEREEVDPATLVAGDLVAIPAGEAAPADAVVLTGRTEFDESLLTGETFPVSKATGDTLLAGSVNLASPVEARVLKGVGTATLDQIRAQMERAATEKPHWALLADRIAGQFVLAVIVLALGGAIAWLWIEPSKALWVAVATLVVTCPCALSLATPVALTAAVRALAKQGTLVTRGRAIEALASVTHLVMDKTGTLTTGRMALHTIDVFGRESREGCLAIAAALETALSHPIAHALVKARPEGLALPEATDISVTAGGGVEARVGGRKVRIGSAAFCEALAGTPFPGNAHGDTPMAALAAEVEWLAAFHFDDVLRPEAAAVVAAARREGCEVVMLSGDRQSVVDRVAGELGITQRIAAASPDEKARRVAELAAGGAVVAMVGDGINDAPVLARAQVSIALGSGAALAQSQADLVVASPSLMAVADAIALAKKTRRVIRQNIGWSIVYNAVSIPLALSGLLTPWLASLGMSLSSLLVVANALRLLRVPSHPEASKPPS